MLLTHRASLLAALFAGATLGWLPAMASDSGSNTVSGARRTTPIQLTRITTYSLDIPTGSLDSSLQSFALACQHKLFYKAGLVEGKTAPALKGDYTAERAVKELLSRTTLVYEITSSAVVLIKDPGEREASSSSRKMFSTKSNSSPLRMARSRKPSADSGTFARSAASAAGLKLEEVVVTAQKRQENLQDIPFSISAIGGQHIEETGLRGLDDLMGMVPGVSFTAFSPGEGNLVLRGISTGAIDASVNNRTEAVGLYINDTPVGQPRFNPDISPFDLERVEVLRGPQGTLYGSGSLAGTVRYITRRPNTRDFESKIGADVSSTKRGGINQRVDAMVNVPLSDTFALRAVGYEQFDDGYIRGVGPGQRGHDENDAEQYGGRIAVRWEPSERFAADLSAMIQRLDRDMTSQDNEGFAFSRGVPVGPYEQYRESAGDGRNRFNLYNLTLEYDLGWGSLTSSTSLLDNENNRTTDFNASLRVYFPGVDLTSHEFLSNGARNASQELRFATDFEGPLNFIGGVFYTDQNREQFITYPAAGFDAVFTIPNFGVDSTAFGANVDELLRQNVDIDERQVAVFGELTYEMTEKLGATVGLRWFDVEQDYYIATVGLVSSRTPPLNRTSGESDFNPKFLISYALSDDVLLSAQATRGFRLGGTNELVPEFLCAADLAALGLTEGPESFQSENVWNYELNAKTAWLDRRLTVNGSAYHIDYKDIQVLTPIPCGFPFTDNAASARSRGVEIELAARPLRGLHVSIGGAYTDAELTVDVPRLGGKAGDQLPMSARFTGAASARYDFPFAASIDAFLQYSYRYSDRILFAFDPEANPATATQPAPAYDLHNLRLGLETARWNASLYVNNILDEEIVSFVSRLRDAERLRTRGQPRTVGLSVSANFR